jgi:hypothetical protein
MRQQTLRLRSFTVTPRQACSATRRRKGSDGKSFLAREISVAIEFDLPIVVANVDSKRTVDRTVVPQPLPDVDRSTVSVSFQPAITGYTQITQGDSPSASRGGSPAGSELVTAEPNVAG